MWNVAVLAVASNITSRETERETLEAFPIEDKAEVKLGQSLRPTAPRPVCRYQHHEWSLPAALYGALTALAAWCSLLLRLPARTRSTARCCAKKPATDDRLHASYRPRGKGWMASHLPGFVQAALHLPELGFAVFCRVVECAPAFHLQQETVAWTSLGLLFVRMGGWRRTRHCFPSKCCLWKASRTTWTPKVCK